MAYSVSFLYKIIDKMTPVLKKAVKENKKLEKSILRVLGISQKSAKEMADNTKKQQSRAKKIYKSTKAVVISGIEEIRKSHKKQLKDSERSFRNFFRNTASGFKHMRSKSLAFGRSLRDLGQKTRVASATAALGLLGTVTAYAKYEKGLKNVLNLAEDDTAIKKWKKSIDEGQKSAIALGFGIEDSTNAMFDSVSGLGMGANALATYKSALTLAKGGNAGLSTSLGGLVSVMNAYELSADKADKVARSMFIAQRIGRTDIAEMSSVIGRVAPIAKSAGLGVDEMTSALAIFTKGGLDTQQASVAMINVFTQLLKRSDRLGTAIKKKLNIPLKLSEIRAQGAVKMFMNIIKATKDHGDAVSRVFPNIRAMIGGLSLTEENLKLMEKAMSEMNASTDKNSALMKAYSNIMDSVANETSKTKGNITVLAIELGEKLRPLVIKILKLLNKFVDWFSKTSDSTQIFSIAVVGLIAVLSPLLTIVGTLVSIFGGIPVLITAVVAGIIAMTTWMWKNYDAINNWFDSFGILGKIIKWIVMGPIFLLISSAKMIIKNWEPIKTFFRELGEEIKIVFGFLEEMTKGGLMDSIIKKSVEMSYGVDLSGGKNENESTNLIKYFKNLVSSDIVGSPSPLAPSVGAEAPTANANVSGVFTIKDESGRMVNADTKLTGFSSKGKQ